MKRNELKIVAARFVTIGLMTLVAACGGNNQQNQPPINPGGITQGQVACMPIQPGQQMAFTATGIALNSVNLQFGRLPNGQTIGQVAMGGMAMNQMGGGMYYTGGSNATGSTISVSLQNSAGMGTMPGQFPQQQFPQQTGGGQPDRIMGTIQISQYEMQLAGLNQQYMSPMPGGQYPQQYPGQYPQQYPQNGTGVIPGATGQACVNSVGATGALNQAYAKFYGGASDYVYVYINNGQSYIRFKI